MNLLILKLTFSNWSLNPDHMKAPVYPEKQSIHRAVYHWSQLNFGSYAWCFMKRAHLLRTFKVRVPWWADWLKDRARGEVYAVCGWHYVCAASLQTSSSVSKEHEAGIWGGTCKLSFSKAAGKGVTRGLWLTSLGTPPPTVPGTGPRRQNLLVLLLNNFVQIAEQLQSIVKSSP